jgi:hypothetical protein
MVFNQNFTDFQIGQTPDTLNFKLVNRQTHLISFPPAQITFLNSDNVKSTRSAPFGTNFDVGGIDSFRTVRNTATVRLSRNYVKATRSAPFGTSLGLKGIDSFRTVRNTATVGLSRNNVKSTRSAPFGTNLDLEGINSFRTVRNEPD